MTQEMTHDEAQALVEKRAMEFAVATLIATGISDRRIERAKDMMAKMLDGSAPVATALKGKRRRKRLSTLELTALRDATWMMIGHTMGKRIERERG